MLSKIIIIENELSTLLNLKKLVSSLDYKVVATYDSTEDFLEETDWQFDIALLDIFLSGILTGLDAAKAIRKRQKPFIFITGNKDSKIIHEAAKLAPSAYLSKPFQAADLEAALTILKLKINSPLVDPFYYFLKDNDYTTTPLTKKEIEVLKPLIIGSSNKVIGEKLYISLSTVKTHVRNLYKKFKLNSKGELKIKIDTIFK